MRVANYLDFLVVFDDHIRRSSLGFVTYGHELYGIAQQAGLATPSDESPARWTGELVAAGYLSHGPLGLGDPRPLRPGAYMREDLSRVSDYRITATAADPTVCGGSSASSEPTSRWAGPWSCLARRSAKPIVPL